MYKPARNRTGDPPVLPFSTGARIAFSYITPPSAFLTHGPNIPPASRRIPVALGHRKIAADDPSSILSSRCDGGRRELLPLWLHCSVRESKLV